MHAWEAAKNALECVLEARRDENIVIFCDEEKLKIGEAFAIGALKLDLKTHMVKLKAAPNYVRKQVPKEAIEVFRKQSPDLCINLLRGFREETPFRIELTKLETESRKSRLAHCPGITMDMLTDGALALATREHRKMQRFAETLIGNLDGSVKVEITNPSGTKISMSVQGRPFFTDTIIDWKTLKWMNMPTGEVIVAPVENSAKGILVCDMAIGGIGPLETSVEITTEKGKVQDTSSKDGQLLKRVEDSLRTDERSDIIGEFAFGINPKARFVEEFLEAEKILGTVHMAFGNNSDMPGGKNPSRNHMDLLISKPTVRAFYGDDTCKELLVNGAFTHL